MRRTATWAVMAGLALAPAAAPAPAAELARTGVLAPAFDPIGFAGDELLTDLEGELVAFGPAGRRRVLSEPALRSAVTADGTLALVRGGYGDELLVGPVDGPKRSVLRCPPPGHGLGNPPVVSGGRVLWTTCDQGGLVIAEGGRTWTVDASGDVRAFALDGDRAAWVTADGARPRKLTVRTLDLGSGEAVVAGSLGEDDAYVIGVTVAVARDGRLQASRERLTGDRATCATLAEGQTGPPSPRSGPCPHVVAFTPDGSVVSTPASLPGSRGRIARLDRAGMTQATITTYAAGVLRRPSVVADARRVAARLLVCRGARLVADDLSRASFPKPACPILPRRRHVVVSAAGIVRVGVRCPSGCLAAPVGIDLRLGRLGGVFGADSFLDVQPGSTRTVRFRLSAAQRRGVRRRRSVPARVQILGYEDAHVFSVRLRAAR